MYQLVIENTRSEQLQLNPSNDYVITDIVGLTPTGATINSATSVNVDGARINSSRLNMRNLVIAVHPRRNVEANRIELYRFAKPKENVKVYYRNQARDVYIEGKVETIDGTPFSNNETLQLSILCPEPYWKSVGEVVDDITQEQSLFMFPFAIASGGIAFSEYQENQVATIVNDSDIETGMTIELNANGDITNPKIIDADTNEYLELTTSLENGDKVTINTNVGKKSIVLLRGGVKTNIINTMSDESTWLTAQYGANHYAYEASSGESNMLVTIKMTTQFIGV